MNPEADNIIDLYNRKAQAWVSERLKEAVHLYERKWLERFSAIVGPSGAILDIGCGAGEPIASYLIGEGYSVTGVDSSDAMIKFFKQRHSNQAAIVADMRTLNLNRRFNGILVWDSYFHLTCGDQRKMFSIFQTHAASGAALMFTSGHSHGEAVGQLEGEPLYHASLAPDEYKQLLNSHGFEFIANVFEDQDCGNRNVWLARLK